MRRVMSFFKRMAYRLPQRRVQALKRQHFARQILGKRFTSEEPEYFLLDELVAPGDWVLDIGANVGTYSHKLSQIVGRTGRVFAVEPVPETFELLVANAQLFPYQNVTLLNIAASNETRIVHMTVPVGKDGASQHHLARIVAKDGGTQVLAAPIDSLPLAERVTLAKIDAEGHELNVLEGMRSLLRRDRPVLIVEASSDRLVQFLADFGYGCEQAVGSWNYVFRYKGVPACCS